MKPVLTDAGGLPISTESPLAAASYLRGIERLLARHSNATSTLRDAVRLDPQFALAWIALAIAVADDDGDVDGEAERSALSAVANAATSSRRERQHVEVIRLLISGDRHRAAVLGREHLLEFPTDVVVAHVLGSRGLS